MKKRMTIVIMVCVCVMSLMTGCQKKRECDFCCENAKCQEKKILGETVYICDDCMAELQEDK